MVRWPVAESAQPLLPHLIMPAHHDVRPGDVVLRRLHGSLAAAADYGLPVIEDAAESLGARLGGRKLGTLGRIGRFSFNGNKLLTTGGGGMLVTQDTPLARRARYLTTQAKEPGDAGEHGEVGYNYRLTSLQAAFGQAQLERLD